MAQGDHGIYRGGAASWDVAGCEGYGDEQGRNGGEGERIGGADAEQQIGHQAREREGSHKPDRSSDDRELQPFAENLEQNFALLRAQRHADANFVGALSYEVGDYAVDADAGEQERDDGEGSEKNCGKTLGGGGIADDFRHGLRAVNDLFAVHLLQGMANGIEED